MLGALIGAGLGLAGTIAGGIGKSKARRKQREQLEQQQRENQAWYDRRYNEDATKRADAVRMLTLMNDQIRNRNRAAKGRQAVMGGTEDSVTAERESNNKVAADTTSQIIANADARKNNIEQQYLNNKRQIDGSKMQLQAQAAEDAGNMVSGVAATAGSIAQQFDNYKVGQKSDTKTGTV